MRAIWLDAMIRPLPLHRVNGEAEAAMGIKFCGPEASCYIHLWSKSWISSLNPLFSSILRIKSRERFATGSLLSILPNEEYAISNPLKINTHTSLARHWILSQACIYTAYQSSGIQPLIFTPEPLSNRCFRVMPNAEITRMIDSVGFHRSVKWENKRRAIRPGAQAGSPSSKPSYSLPCHSASPSA